MSVVDDSVAEFVGAVLQRLLALSSRKHKQFRADAEELLAAIRAKTRITLALLFRPFESACRTGSQKVVELALDSIAKMIASGVIRGSSRVSERAEKRQLDVVVETVCDCFDLQDDAVQLQIMKCLVATVTSPHCEVHNASLLRAVRTGYNIHLVSRVPVTQSTAKGGLTQILLHVLNNMERSFSNQINIDTAETSDPYEASLLEVASFTVTAALNDGVQRAIKQDLRRRRSTIMAEARARAESVDTTSSAGQPKQTVSESETFLRDAFIIFRALCRLSMKDLPVDVAMDSVEYRSKLLSLELILAMLRSSGPVFRSSDKFLRTIEEQLFQSLISNGLNEHPKILQLALEIFFQITQHMRQHFKHEIGVFLSNCLTIMRTPNSAFAQKREILMMLTALLRDGQMSVDIFLNFDCDIGAENLFERMVAGVSEVSQGKWASNWVTPEQSVELHSKSLLMLTTIAEAMRKYLDTYLLEGGALAPTDDDGFATSSATDALPPMPPPPPPPPPQPSSASAPAARSTPHAPSDSIDAPSAAAAAAAGAPDTLDDASSSIGSTTGAASLTALLEMMRSHPETPEQVERLKRFKAVMDEGVRRFNEKPRSGIDFLKERGHLDDEPATLAQFLLHADGLSKLRIGEYLGHHNNVPVLHAFVDQLSFRALEFDEALRLFLTRFRLPGEGQMIDRIMLKFAERYHLDNPDAFSCADTAYVLAYSCIMLHTDAHSTQVINKMKVEEWLRNNEGIDNGNDLPEEFMTELYNRICAHEIKLHEDIAAQVTVGLNPKQKIEFFKLESSAMMKQAQELLRDKTTKPSVFRTGQRAEFLRPMIDVTWAPLLAALSVSLEQTDNMDDVRICLRGLRSCVRMVCVFGMATERDAFVSAIGKFTLLNTQRELHPKNIECIKLLLRIALEEGDFLQSGWYTVLVLISQLARLHFIASGVKELSVESSRHLVPSPVDLANAQMVLGLVPPVLVDRVFTNTSRLNSDAIVDFVTELSRLVMREISLSEHRLYSLHRLVDVTTYNMERIRVVWGRMWQRLGVLFREVGVHPSVTVANSAIDALRQLSRKFLEKDELSSFSFQREFLAPFEAIFATNSNESIRDYILRCIQQLVLSLAPHIKSGWGIIFRVLALSAKADHDDLVSCGFVVIKDIVTTKMQLVSEFFVECCDALNAFANNQRLTPVCKSAIQLLKECARMLATSEVGAAVTSADAPFKFSDDPRHLRLWFPILMSLQPAIQDRRLDVRSDARVVLFDVLKEYGSMFSASFWRLVFSGVLLPIFQMVRHGSHDLTREDEEWLETTCFGCMYAMVELFPHFFAQLQELLEDTLALLRDSMTQPASESLARMAVTCLTHLVCMTGKHFAPVMWMYVVTMMSDVLEAMRPVELYAYAADERHANDAEFDRVDAESDLCDVLVKHEIIDEPRRKAIVQKLLVHCIDDVVNGLAESIDTELMHKLLLRVGAARLFAREFNYSRTARGSWARESGMHRSPTLRRLEVACATSELRTMIKLFQSPVAERRESATEALFALLAMHFEEYQFEALVSSDELCRTHAQSMVPMLIEGLRFLSDLPEATLRSHIHLLFRHYVGLVASPDAKLRQALRSALQRVGSLLSVPVDAPDFVTIAHRYRTAQLGLRIAGAGVTSPSAPLNAPLPHHALQASMPGTPAALSTTAVTGASASQLVSTASVDDPSLDDADVELEAELATHEALPRDSADTDGDADSSTANSVASAPVHMSRAARRRAAKQQQQQHQQHPHHGTKHPHQAASQTPPPESQHEPQPHAEQPQQQPPPPPPPSSALPAEPALAEAPAESA